MAGTRGSFSHVHTIYTGSNPQTTPSTGPCSHPDSGFHSRTRSPLEPSSSEQSTENNQQSATTGRARILHNNQASDFNDPSVIGHQGPPQQKQYPVLNSVVKSKPRSPPSEEEEKGTHDGGFSQMGKEEEGIGYSGRLFVGGMVQHRDYLSDIQEDDYRSSDREKDGGVLPPPSVQQYTGLAEPGPGSSEYQSDHGLHPSPTESSPPISIPLRKKVTPESNLSEQSSLTSSIASSNSVNWDLENSHNNVATQPKKLQRPSKWKRFKEYIMNGVEGMESATCTG